MAHLKNKPKMIHFFCFLLCFVLIQCKTQTTIAKTYLKFIEKKHFLCKKIQFLFLNSVFGPVEGLDFGSYRRFEGVPFAEPPLNHLRFSNFSII